MRVFGGIASVLRPGVWTVAICVMVAMPAEAQQSLSLSNETVVFGTTGTIEVSLTNDEPVEGFELSVAYDETLAQVTDFHITDTIAETVGAELVVGEVFQLEGGATLGVVLDASAPFDFQTIPTGTDQVIAKIDVKGAGLPGGDTVTFEFVDGEFNSPPLDNVIVQGGESILALDEMTVVNGSVFFPEVEQDMLFIEDDVEIFFTFDLGCAAISINNTVPLQGYVLSVIHPEDDVNLEIITLAGTTAGSVGAEFVVPEIYVDGGTVAVVLDFDAPFGGQTIPIGGGNVLANFCYSVNEVEFGTSTTYPLEFADGVFGTPALDNTIVAGGLTFDPDITDTGSILVPGTVPNDEQLHCGVTNEEGDIVDVTAFPGETVEMCVYYVSPNDVQGIQAAMRVCDDAEDVLCFVNGSFTIEDTILEEIGTEYISQSQDCDPFDGDGIEQTIGILLDALPPFDDQTLPPTETPLKFGTFELEVSQSAQCDACYCVVFSNGVNGAEALGVDNLFVVDFEGIKRFRRFNCNVCIAVEHEFQRGDCNNDTMVNIADAASMLGLQFQNLGVDCVDACDSNDDGKVNLADTVFLLNYLLKSGDPPGDPGPTDVGPDPTADELGCENGVDPCT